MYRTFNDYIPTEQELKILKGIYPSAQPSGMAVGSQREKKQRKV
jgi:hypothetical protein